MTESKPNRRLCLVLAVAVALVPSDALAYIDPGTGAMLLQLLLGGIAGALVVVKLYWSRLREVTARMMGGDKEKAEDGTGDPN